MATGWTTSRGDGRNAVTPSRSRWIPLFFSALPQNTGMILRSRVACRSAPTISSNVISSSLMNFSVNASEVSARVSSSFARHSWARGCSSSGMDSLRKSVPRLCSS